MPLLPPPATHDAGPLVTHRSAVLLLAPALVLAACGPGGNPFASFETRCGKLALSRFEVVAVPLTFERDDTQPIAALTVKSGSTIARHSAIGLTRPSSGKALTSSCIPLTIAAARVPAAHRVSMSSCRCSR